MKREERRQARIERYLGYAENAKIASTKAYEHSHDLVKDIPLGQPIMPGNKGKALRNTLDKSRNAMGRSVKLNEKAEYYRQKAEATKNNNAIYLEDEDAVEKLTQKIKELENLQELMKGVNKIVRVKKLTDDEKIRQIQALGVSEQYATKLVTETDCFGNLGFASYTLTNNNANIRRYKERLEQATRLQETEIKEYEINGVKVCENSEENRLQLFFDGKPREDVRKTLKSNGFRWAPSSMCWQSYLNRCQIDRAKQILETI